jgi:hypothetical protein
MVSSSLWSTDHEVSSEPNETGSPILRTSQLDGTSRRTMRRNALSQRDRQFAPGDLRHNSIAEEGGDHDANGGGGGDVRDQEGDEVDQLHTSPVGDAARVRKRITRVRRSDPASTKKGGPTSTVTLDDDLPKAVTGTPRRHATFGAQLYVICKAVRLLKFPRTAAFLSRFSPGGFLYFGIFTCTRSPLYKQVAWLLLAVATISRRMFPLSATADRTGQLAALYGALCVWSSFAGIRHVYGAWTAISLSYGIPLPVEWLFGITPSRVRLLSFVLIVAHDVVAQHVYRGGRGATYAVFLALLVVGAHMHAKVHDTLLFHALLAAYVNNMDAWM